MSCEYRKTIETLSFTWWRIVPPSAFRSLRMILSRHSTIKSYLSVLFLPLVLFGCGGGGNSSSPPPPPPPPPGPTTVTIVEGDQQSTFAGGMLLVPLHVSVKRSDGSVPNPAKVAFSVPSGVQLTPSQLTVGPKGDARTLVYLPATPNSEFDIVATADTGGAATFHEFTGPRIVHVFGNASVLNGAVAADGTFLAMGQGTGINENCSPAVFAPDGTLRAFLGSPLQKPNIPDPNVLGWNGSAFGSPTVTGRDGMIYFNTGPGIEVLNTNLDLVRFIDPVFANSTVEPEDLFAVDKSGNVYAVSSTNSDQPTVQILGQDGKTLKSLAVSLPGGTSAIGIGVNDAGNIVLLVSDGSANNSLREFDSTGNLVRTATLTFSYGPSRMVQDPQGRFVIAVFHDVYVFDQQYNQVMHIQSGDAGFGSDLRGMDSASNVYMVESGNYTFQLVKYDSNGNRLWSTGAYPTDDPKTVYPSPFLIQSSPSVVSDPTTNDVLILHGGWVFIYANGIYQSTFRAPANVSMSLDSSGELYFPVYDYNSGTSSVTVTDQTGKLLRTIAVPGFGKASGIAIDPNDNKYLMDVANSAVLVLDPSDTYVGTLKLNVPQGQTFDAGGIAWAPDGTLVLNVSSLLNVGSTIPASYVKKVRLDGTELWSTSITSDWSRVHNVAVDNLGRIYVLRGLAFEVWDGNGNKTGEMDLGIFGNDGVDLVGLSSWNNQLFMYQGGRVFVLSLQ